MPRPESTGQWCDRQRTANSEVPGALRGHSNPGCRELSQSLLARSYSVPTTIVDYLDAEEAAHRPVIQ